MTADRSPMGIAMADPQSWNLYSYVRNRPTGSVDARGNWATPIHVEISTFALQGYMSAGDLQRIVNRQYVMDAEQSAEHQYRHAMHGPNQSAQGASSEMWNFVADSINGANATLTAGGGFTSISLDWLGDAIHTVQDYTSPEHTSASGEPMMWPGSAPAYWGHDLMHWAGENSANRDWSAIGMAVRLTMAAYMQANPESAAQHGLTEKTFDAEADKRISEYVDWVYSPLWYWPHCMTLTNTRVQSLKSSWM